MAELKKRKTYIGRVVSAKMDKTVVVLVETKTQHKRYKKIIKRGKRYKAHDEKNICKEGDIVKFIEVRPLSKTKRWAVIEVLKTEVSE